MAKDRRCFHHSGCFWDKSGRFRSSSCTTSPPVINQVIILPQGCTVPHVGPFLVDIRGTGFGTGPQWQNGFTATDTVKSNLSPSLGICDTNQGWSAVGKYSGSVNVGSGCSVSGYDYVGVVLVSWTNTDIILNGYGSAIPGSSSHAFHIHSGDKLAFVVFGPNNSGASNPYVTYYNGPNV